MNTIHIKVDNQDLSEDQINTIKEVVSNEGLVVFPTETVYGLGANAFNIKSINKIFETKGRPKDNPLIVHISNLEQLNELVEDIPPHANKLIEKFWPGPLTLIFKRNSKIPKEVSAGLDSIAIRFPENDIARQIIDSCGPIAAPSANISGRPSGTNKIDVLEDLDGKVECIVLGDKSDIGIESTVFSLVSLEILRPGKISIEEIQEIIPEAKLCVSKSNKPASPGMKYKHYSPNAKVLLCDNQKEIQEFIERNPEKKIKLICEDNKEKLSEILFSEFRKADREKMEIILVKKCDEKGIGAALMDRLRKAASN